jgi:cobalt-zinc-cadmium resistance protein CzcA
LISALAEKLQTVPGVVYNFTQPMAMRLDETVSGVRADVAVKIFGDDERILERKADEVLRWLSQVRGAADTQREVFSGAAEWQVRIKRDQLARYGLNVTDVEDLVESAIGGKFVTELIDGRRRFRVVVRLPKEHREGREQIGALLLPAPGGELVPLSEVAEIVESSGPEVVNREHSQRRIVVQCNVRGRDIGSFVGEAQQVIARNVDFPVGYFIRWGGQFEHQESAMRRLSVLLPIVVGVIFFVLYTTFGSFRQSFLVLLLVPFATVGGVAALWLRDMNLNVSASIGFIAVFGVAITDGLVLVSAINHIRQEGVPIREALMRAAGLRLRPVVMTSVVAALGFLPMALATSIGAEVQRPLATVVIGGLCSSTLLTLFMIPVLFPWFEGRKAAERA